MTRLFSLLTGLVLLVVWGCAQGGLDRQAFLLPWQKRPDKVPGVKTPQDRIEELKAIETVSAAEAPALAEQLAKEIQNEQDPQVRVQIIRVLANVPDVRAAAVLHAGLQDPEEMVRIACCEAWGVRGGSEAVEELATVLQAESNVDVRMAAARALGITKNSSAVQPLAEVLADNDPAMQRRAIESLKSVSGKDYGYDVQAWRQYAAGEPVQRKELSLAERILGRDF
jgi:HEAT repeat protein